MIAKAIPEEAAHRSAVQRPKVILLVGVVTSRVWISRPEGISLQIGPLPRRSPGVHDSLMATDHMPLDGWDHLELWVGNAKQAAYWYEHALGFGLTAYAGPETGVRDRASYVLEQAEIRIVVTGPLREASEISQHVARHGDAVKDIALAVPDATEAYRQAVQRGARGVVEPHWVEDEDGGVELAAIATYGDTLHTFVNRSEYGGA